MGASERSYAAGDLPVSIGQGSDADLALPGNNGAAGLVWLGASDNGIFVQSDSEDIALNDAVLTRSHWLADGDRLRIGSHRISVAGVGEELVLDVYSDLESNATLPPAQQPA